MPRVDVRVDLIAGPGDVSPVDHVVADRRPQLRRQIATQGEAQIGHERELMLSNTPMLLGRASNPPDANVAACPGIEVVVAPTVITREWVWPTATFSTVSRVQELVLERCRHARLRRLRTRCGVEEVHCSNDAPGGKARWGAGESQRSSTPR